MHPLFQVLRSRRRRSASTGRDTASFYGYKITISCGYDASGKQIRRHMTWIPEPGMTVKQEAKELERQKVLFEEKVRSGNYADGNVKFETLGSFM